MSKILCWPHSCYVLQLFNDFFSKMYSKINFRTSKWIRTRSWPSVFVIFGSIFRNSPEFSRGICIFFSKTNYCLFSPIFFHDKISSRWKNRVTKFFRSKFKNQSILLFSHFSCWNLFSGMACFSTMCVPKTLLCNLYR